MLKKYKYEEMFPDEFLKAVEEMPIFFIPTGLLEWHGNHLPLGLDALKAHGICLKIAERIGGGIVLPANYYGRPGFSSYAGTMTFSEGCLDILFTELFTQLKKLGAKIIIVITGHYGPLQVDFIKRVSEHFMIENSSIKIIAEPEYEDVTIDGVSPADHAGKWETSIMLAVNESLVDVERFKKEEESPKIYNNPPNDYYHESEQWNWQDDVKTLSSKELGERAIEEIVKATVNKINEF